MPLTSSPSPLTTTPKETLITFTCAGQTFCLAATEVLYLSALAEITWHQDIACLVLSGDPAPVYSLNAQLEPAMGGGPADTHCLLLRGQDGIRLALACSQVQKLRTPARWHALPGFMCGPAALVCGMLKLPDGWLFRLDSQHLLNWFEQKGAQDDNTLSHARLAG